LHAGFELMAAEARDTDGDRADSVAYSTARRTLGDEPLVLRPITTSFGDRKARSCSAKTCS